MRRQGYNYYGTTYRGTTLGDILTNAEHTTNTLSMNEVSVSCFRFKFVTGRVPWRMVYRFFSSPMTRSTCIRTFAIFCEHSTSCKLSCFFPLVKEGMTSEAPWTAISSAMSKPRSASITIGTRSLDEYFGAVYDTPGAWKEILEHLWHICTTYLLWWPFNKKFQVGIH